MRSAWLQTLEGQCDSGCVPVEAVSQVHSDRPSQVDFCAIFHLLYIPVMDPIIIQHVFQHQLGWCTLNCLQHWSPTKNWIHNVFLPDSLLQSHISGIQISCVKGRTPISQNFKQKTATVLSFCCGQWLKKTSVDSEKFWAWTLTEIDPGYWQFTDAM